jgi:hypothetical protein
MRSTIHPVRIALGASAVLAAALVTSACGSETAVDPPPAHVGGAPDAVTGGDRPSGDCSVTADQAQRRIDAGEDPCGGSDDATSGPLGYGAASDEHLPLR